MESKSTMVHCAPTRNSTTAEQSTTSHSPTVDTSLRNGSACIGDVLWWRWWAALAALEPVPLEAGDVPAGEVLAAALHAGGATGGVVALERGQDAGGHALERRGR